MNEAQTRDIISIEEIAEYLQLTVWDWLAVLIALLSFCIACLSLFYAIKTLKSQRQTEKNTLPIINLDIQRFQLCDLIRKLLDGHMRLTALWHMLNNHAFKVYPTERILRLIKIPQDIIHIELFYNNYVYYRCMQGLIDMIDDYNTSIDILENHLKDSSVDGDFLYNEFFHITNKNDSLAESWDKIMTIVFGYNKEDKSSLFDEYIENISDDVVSGHYDNVFYKSSEVYSDFLIGDVNKKKMLLFMETTTARLSEEFSNFILERK